MAGAECPSHLQLPFSFRLFTTKAKKACLPPSAGSQDRKDPRGLWPRFLILLYLGPAAIQ